MPMCPMREKEAGGVPGARLSRLGGHARTVIGQDRGTHHYPGLLAAGGRLAYKSCSYMPWHP